EGDVELSSLKDVISQEVQKEKKFDLISSKISDGSTLESVATLYSVDVKTVEGVNFDNPNVNGLGVEQNFVGAVNALPNGSISAVIEGNNSAIILKVISKTEPNITEVNETQKKEFANSNFTGVFYNAVMKILQDNAEVTDNRVRFY
ncbi:MAG: peptidyl-prolyl cis-trans isomerase, partial [Flavobacteriales bacterium]|nr:peptidyl-prolyl cis-trans isomerase [Flavobacteriales bacterium]